MRNPFKTAAATVYVAIEPEDDPRLDNTLEVEISSDVDPPDPSVGINGPVPLGPEEVKVMDGPRGQNLRAPTELEDKVITDWLTANSDRFDEMVVEQLEADEEEAYERAMEDKADMMRDEGRLW